MAPARRPWLGPGNERPTRGRRWFAARRALSDFTEPESLDGPESGAGDLAGVGDEQGRVTLVWDYAGTPGSTDSSIRIHSATWEPILAGWSEPEVLATPASSSLRRWRSTVPAS